jgi:hypothetical protein
MHLLKTFFVFAILFPALSFQKNSDTISVKPSFSAKLNGWNKTLDTLSATVTINNNTSGQLNFVSYLCDWQKIFTIDSAYLFTEETICAKEGFKTITLQPHDSISYVLIITSIKKYTQLKDLKFKIGFYYVTPASATDKDVLGEEETGFNSEKNIIWSNTLEIK